MEEIQVCKVDKGKVTIKPRFDQYEEIFKVENPADVFGVIQECVTFQQPAWYISVEYKTSSPVEVVLVNSGKISESERLAIAYREKAEEDIEIANELSWTRVNIIEHEDKKR